MSTSDFWFIDAKKELLQEVGKVTVRWATLDLLMMWVVATALDNYELSRKLIFGSHDAGRKRIESFKEIIGTSRFDQKQRTQLIELANKFQALLPERNSLIHDPTVTSLKVDGKSLVMSINRLSRSGKSDEISEKDVSMHVAKVEALLEQLELCWNELLEEYDPESLQTDIDD